MVMSGPSAGVVMVEWVPTIDEIDSSEKLEAYLRTRPVEEAQVIAHRAAMRNYPSAIAAVEPLFSTVHLNDIQVGLLRIFRAAFVGWQLLRYPEHPNEMAAIKSSFNSNEKSASSIGLANIPLGIRRVLKAAIASIRQSEVAYSSSGEQFWFEVQADCNFLTQNLARDLIVTSIWRSGSPPITTWTTWIHAQKTLQKLGEHWILVRQWFDVACNSGTLWGALGEQKARFSYPDFLDDEFWSRDPAVVIEEIALRLGATQKAQISEGVSLLFSSSVGEDVSKNVDFFISYSTKNVAYAREINGYLEDAGYSTIAQFKDFPVGSNFVIEMQEGLERGARAIALLSPDYVASDHCRAEWAAIYAMDPIGKRRKLVSFLLEPTELNKLQRQIVYSSLIGLKQDARRKAVLDAIRHVVEVVTPDQLKQKLADIVSPDVAVTADGKIDVTPNAKYDLAVNSLDFPDLPTNLRGLCTIIIESLPENSPKTIAPTLRGYRGHLEERGAKPAIGFLGMLVAALTKEFESADFEFWGSGVNEHFESFFACHSKFLCHFPRSGERELTYAEAEINEDEASGDDLIQPVQSVADAVEELKTIGKVTPDLERVVQGQVQIAKDVSSLPPNLSEDAGKGNVITPKRRFVLSQLGFWERMLAAVGSMTTLATTPQGQAAIAALREAIAKFLSLIL